MDKEQEKTLSLLMRAMIKYDGGDVPRIQHFVKVHDGSHPQFPKKGISLAFCHRDAKQYVEFVNYLNYEVDKSNIDDARHGQQRMCQGI